MVEATRNHASSVWAATAVWAALLSAGVVIGLRMGFGGWRFGFAMAVCAILLAGDLLPAARSVREKLMDFFGARGRDWIVIIPLVAILTYELGVAANWKLALFGSAYVLAPTLLLAWRGVSDRASRLDFAAMLIVWLPVQFRWVYWLFPFPSPLTHTLTMLLAMNAGVAAFIFARRLPGIGYEFEWRRGFAAAVGLNFLTFTLIAIPLGELIGFVHWDPSLARLRAMPLLALGIFFFTAWPEEFLFRGLLQNLLARSLRNQRVGLIVAAVIFGFSHILHAPFPNWRYVILASIAGIFYGRAWMKTGSLVPGAILHGCVDILWHLLFR